MAQRTVHELYVDLRDCQRRLGTIDEVAGDFERAHALAHEINNLRAADLLRAFLDANSDRLDVGNATARDRAT